MVAKLDLKQIMPFFDDDPVAQKILLGMAEGGRGEDLQEVTSLGPQGVAP